MIHASIFMGAAPLAFLVLTAPGLRDRKDRIAAVSLSLASGLGLALVCVGLGAVCG